jgi:hypothetical protein
VKFMRSRRRQAAGKRVADAVLWVLVVFWKGGGVPESSPAKDKLDSIYHLYVNIDIDIFLANFV